AGMDIDRIEEAVRTEARVPPELATPAEPLPARIEPAAAAPAEPASPPDRIGSVISGLWRLCGGTPSP
ncbi:MAG: hypothetical protein ACK5U4_05475, partial [Rhodospirillales bacterium]